MSMVIQNNIMALNSQRQLGINNSNVKKSLEKLSTGYRINRAADDAAGLAISEKMRAQVTGLERAVLNAQDGVSLVQTAEGALTEVHSILNRMVELATESANGTLQSDDRLKIEAEVTALKDEVDRVSQATNFNGIKLIDGSLDKEWREVTSIHPSGDITTTTVNPSVAWPGFVEVTGGGLDSVPDSFLTQGDGTVRIESTPAGNFPDTIVFKINTRDGGEISFPINILGQINMNDNASYEIDLSPFGKVQMKNATSMSSLDPERIVFGLAQRLNDSMTPSQMAVTPKDVSVTEMKQVDIDGLILQVGDTADSFNKIAVKIEDMSADGLGILTITMVTQEAASSSLDSIHSAIGKVSENRGRLGSLQNRLDVVINHQNVTVENMTAAESRIRDVDMAKEMMSFQKSQILGQSAQSMLAQANMQPQQVLQLLQ